jgi:hypothetical protein
LHLFRTRDAPQRPRVRHSAASPPTEIKNAAEESFNWVPPKDKGHHIGCPVLGALNFSFD